MGGGGWLAAERWLVADGRWAGLRSVAIWLKVASAFGVPVSTTHSIVGAVAGFAIIQAGPGAIDWEVMRAIVLSWFVSPILGALLGFSMFYLVRRMILNDPDPPRAVLQRLPHLLFLVFAPFIFFFFFQGPEGGFNVVFLRRFRLCCRLYCGDGRLLLLRLNGRGLFRRRRRDGVCGL